MKTTFALATTRTLLLFLVAGTLLVSLPAAPAERVNMATPSRGLLEFPVGGAMRKGFLV